MSVLGLTYLLLGLAALQGAVLLRWPTVYGPAVRPLAGIIGMIYGWFTPQILMIGVLITALMGARLSSGLGLAGLLCHVGAWAVTASAIYRWRSLPLRLEGEAHDPPAGPWFPFFFPRVRPGDEVVIERGLPWREAGVTLRLDIYRPRVPPDRRPAILMLHGGGWVTGRRRRGRHLATELARRGWIVMSVSYRRAPRFPLPAAYHDAVAAVGEVRRRGAELGALDFPPIVVGSSAGGHLASLLALRGAADEAPVSAAVCLYPPIDVERVFRTRHAWGPALFLERMVFLARYADDPARFRDMAPLLFASAEAAPTLFIHGEADGLVPPDESGRLYDALRGVGASTRRLVLPEAPHAFELYPGPGLYRILPTIDDFLAPWRPQA